MYQLFITSGLKSGPSVEVPGRKLVTESIISGSLYIVFELPDYIHFVKFDKDRV